MRARFGFFCMLTVLCAMAVLATASPVLAEEIPSDEEQRPADATAAEAIATEPPVAASGLVVFIDPETGGKTSTPTEEQRAAMATALAASLDRSQDGLYDIVMPNGAVVRDLQGRFQNAVVVRVGADGRLIYDCVTSPAAATAAPAPAATEQTATAATE